MAVVLVVGALIGGAFFTGRASGPYRRSVNRSFAVQASVVVDASNRTGAQLRSLVNAMPTLSRPRLQTELDDLVVQSANDSAEAAALSPPAAPAGVSGDFATVMADRAAAVRQLRSAVDGLLGMAPLPVAGAPSSASASSGPSAILLSTSQVGSELASAGAELAQADRSYAALRRQLFAAGGSARLPRSVWVTDPTLWAPGPVATLVDEVASSRRLAPHHRVELVAVRLDPPAVPPLNGSPPAPAGLPGGVAVSVLPPTGSLTVTAVLWNAGNVAESGLVVSASLQELGAAPGAAGTSVRHTLTLAPSRGAAVVLPALPVRPGSSYVLTVAVTPPAAQTDLSGLTQAVAVVVSPPTPPTTTTTTTAGVTTTTKAP